MTSLQFPQIGLGTWRNTFPGRCEQSIANAIDMGYEHIDTAEAYGNEEYVGKGVKLSNVKREDILIATKIHPDNLAYDDVMVSVEQCLERFGFDYVDLLYIHWPAKSYDPESTFAAFNDLRNDGDIREIGVSNFTPELLKEARNVSDAPIVANQVELHPLWQQLKLREYMDKVDTTLVAYSPLARGRVFEFDTISEVAAKHDVSEAQVSLAWLHQMDNVIPIPMADIDLHQQENHDSLDLTLDQEDIEKIESLTHQQRLVDPEYAPWS